MTVKSVTLGGKSFPVVENWDVSTAADAPTVATMIYHDPVTREKEQGLAVLRRLEASHVSDWEWWMGSVEFVNEPGERYSRLVCLRRSKAAVPVAQEEPKLPRFKVWLELEEQTEEGEQDITEAMMTFGIYKTLAEALAAMRAGACDAMPSDVETHENIIREREGVAVTKHLAELAWSYVEQHFDVRDWADDFNRMDKAVVLRELMHLYTVKEPEAEAMYVWLRGRALIEPKDSEGGSEA